MLQLECENDMGEIFFSLAERPANNLSGYKLSTSIYQPPVNMASYKKYEAYEGLHQRRILVVADSQVHAYYCKVGGE